MTQPGDRELEHFLAKVAGVEVKHPQDWGQPWRYEEETRMWMLRIPDVDTFLGGRKFPTGYVYWTPLTDANQMERVESCLIKGDRPCEIYTIWSPHVKMWEGYCSAYGRPAPAVFHEKKKHAFALAVFQELKDTV